MQKPHCSPWHSAKACWTGFIDSPVGRSGRRAPSKPSTVVIAWSWAVTANIRHERIGWPSTRTVQAPHTPCSQPTWVPVSPRSWRRKSDSSRRAGTAAERRTPLTVTVTSCSVLGLGLARRSCAGSCDGRRPGRRARRVSSRDEHARGSRHVAWMSASGSTCSRTASAAASSAASHAAVPGSTPPSAGPRSSTDGHVGDGDERRASGRHDAVGDRDRHPDAGHRVVAVTPRAPRRRRCRSRPGSGRNALPPRAPRPRATSRARRGRSRTSRSRAPRRAPPTSTTPSVRARIAGISPAASACAMEPTVVPRLRMAGWATLTSAWRSRGSAAYASSECSRPAWRTSAPTRTAVGVTSMVSRPATRLMSTRCAGEARRMLRIGIRLWPPARTLPS